MLAGVVKRVAAGSETIRSWKLTPTSFLQAKDRMLRRSGLRALVRAMEAFGLSPAEAGSLFHVSRQAVNLWLEKGVPTERIASVERVASLADRLGKTFRPERLPQIVRQPMPGIDARSILETIARSGPSQVEIMLDRVRSYVPTP
jgi:hypothetical protein